MWNYRNGTWDEGGHCHTFVSPEMDLTKLESEPLNNLQISEVIKKMEDAQIKAQFINITYLTELRKDGHPSIHREPGTPETAPQDCSHWCLPGVPDTWNELLYVHLLSKQYRTRLKTKWASPKSKVKFRGKMFTMLLPRLFISIFLGVHLILHFLHFLQLPQEI